MKYLLFAPIVLAGAAAAFGYSIVHTVINALEDPVSFHAQPDEERYMR